MPVAHRLARHLAQPAALIACATLWLASSLLQPAAAQTGPTTPGASGGADPDTRSCALLWQVTALLPGGGSTAAPQLRLGLRFQGRGRNQTVLHLPAGWATLGETSDGPSLQAPPGEPTRRLVRHAPGETVQLQWRLQPAADAGRGGSVQLMPTWFAFSGQGVLPMPEGADEPGAGPACILLDGLAPGSRWASSHGTADGASALFVLGPSALPLAQQVQQSLYAGGALQWQAAAGVLAALPGDTPWPFGATALAQAGAQALADQQRHWPVPAGRDGTSPPWLLLALPAAPAATQTTGLASAWQQALLLQLPPAWVGGGPQLQALLTQALARAWTAERFGPLAHAGRGDAALRSWFSEGWAEFLAHRSLLRDGLWTADDYAAALNARIAAYLAEPARGLPNADLVAGAARAPNLAALPAMRGEWLALQWHQALRRSGQPGLEAVLRQQLVAPAQARREGPISAPLATHRLVAALRAVLQDQPLRDLQQHIDQGRPFVFGPDSLGPCFRPVATAEPGAAPAYQPVAGALQQADCQGWLGLGPLAASAGHLPIQQAAAPARGGARKPLRKAGAKAGGKATTKAGGKGGNKAGSKAKPSGQPRSGKPAR